LTKSVDKIIKCEKRIFFGLSLEQKKATLHGFNPLNYYIRKMILNLIIMSNLKIKLAGLDDKEHDVDYFNIVSYDREGDHTLLLVKNGDSAETERLPVAMSPDMFRLRMGDVEKYVNTLKEITFNNLSQIENRHFDFFVEKKSKITDYITITWSQPVEIRFKSDKQLAPEIVDEIKEKLWTVD